MFLYLRACSSITMYTRRRRHFNAFCVRRTRARKRSTRSLGSHKSWRLYTYIGMMYIYYAIKIVFLSDETAVRVPLFGVTRCHTEKSLRTRFEGSRSLAQYGEFHQNVYKKQN